MKSIRTRDARRKIFVSCLLLVAAVSTGAFAQQQQREARKGVPDEQRLRTHIAYLASDKLEGRRTGTEGAGLAARYIAGEFQRLGLQPGGDRYAHKDTDDSTRKAQEFVQSFPYVSGVELGKQNNAVYTSRVVEASPQTTAPATLDLRVGEDWMPLGFSANGRAENLSVAFVGYGISAAELNHDDYKARDVAGRAAFAFAATPDADNPHSQFARYSDLRLRAAAARAAGAKALVFIAADENFKDDKLARLSFDNTGGDAGLPVVVVSRQVAARLLGLNAVAPLGELERATRQAIAAAQGATVGGASIEASATGNSVPAQTALLSISVDIVRREAPASNVVGILYSSDPKLKDEVIVIGAHYDHLGHGGQGSLAAREGEIHHGADDNASGTAGLLELARLLSEKRQGSLRRTVVFVAFGGEEEGLLGSNYYVNHPALPLAQTIAMINMDMVGRLKERTLMIGGVGTAAEWRQWIASANAQLEIRVVAGRDGAGSGRTGGQTESLRRSPGSNTNAEMTVVTGTDGRPVAVAAPAERFALRLNEDGYGPSDHASFYAKRIPVLFFFTGTHEDYHKPSDTAERINYEGEAQILDFVQSVVMALQESERRPTFAVAKSESAGRSTGFRVYLGTVPNYGETNDGLTLDAVREGSPAEKAGLKAGDRIVKMAGRDVRNVYDYTNALAEMKAGQEYEIILVRDGNRLMLRITPAARK